MIRKYNKLKEAEPLTDLLLFWCAPCMGENLVVKVHYRLGSRNC
ncbi:hypothetical protein HMPREF1379_03103 [Enterococcus faecium R497]|nr:hypothetical protein HMPREF1379_03103 [Enterococcus faecium R497]